MSSEALNLRATLLGEEVLIRDGRRYRRMTDAERTKLTLGELITFAFHYIETEHVYVEPYDAEDEVQRRLLVVEIGPV